MPDGLSAAGAQKDPSRSAPLNMSTYISGLITQQNPMAGGAVPYIQQKFYSASRYDRLLGGLNCELSVRLSMVRAPGSSLYNSAVFDRPNRCCSFKPTINGLEEIHVMVDTAANVYDGTGPSTQLNIWNKSAGAGKTQFTPVGNELFFGNGIDQQKWVLSELIWQPDTLYDGAATSDEPLGDFIIDPNGYIQQAVGGFTLLIDNVTLKSNVLTLTLNTSQLADPSGTPTGVAALTGGNLPAGDNYIRIAAVDATGNVTAAGNESADVATTGATSQIDWTWPAVSGAVGYRVYVGNTPGGETTYFTTAVNSFTQTLPTAIASGTPPTDNATSISVPGNLFQMEGVQLTLDGLTTATWLNGQTITISAVLYNPAASGSAPMQPVANGTTGGTYSNQIQAVFANADYPSTPDTGTAVSGTGITGSTEPTFATTLWAVTQDGGAQWINRSSYVQKWGIATPAAAPTVFQSSAPGLYPNWKHNTTYWPSGFVTEASTVETRNSASQSTGGTGSSYWNFVGTQWRSNNQPWTSPLSAMQITNFGFSIPSGATIVGITVSLETVAENPTTADVSEISLWYSGATTGTAKMPASPITTAITRVVYGSTSDLWGAALTPAIINDPSFGFAVSCTLNPTRCFLDTPFTMQVYYTTTGGPGSGIFKITKGGITGDAPPAWDTSMIGATTTDGGVLWSYEGDGSWTAGTAYAEGDYVTYFIPNVGNYVYIAQSAGVSGTDQSSWGGGPGTTVEDGSVTWLCLGLIYSYDTGSSNQFTPNGVLSAYNTIVDSNGYLEQVQDNLEGINTSGAMQPTWASTGQYTAENLRSNITAVEISGDVATLTGANDFSLTEIAVSGLTGVGAALNGSWVPIATTASDFSYDFTAPDLAMTALGGLATQVEATMWLNIGPYAPVGTSPIYYAYAYKNSVTQHVGSSSPRSAAVTIVAGKFANVQGFGSADPQVDTIVIYRTLEGGSTLLEADEIANPGGGVPFTYNDQIPDTGLILEIQAAINGQNNPPPLGFLPSAYHLGRIWGAVGSRLWYSDGPDALTGSGNEAFNPNNYWDLPSAIIKCRATSIGLLIYTNSDVFVETGLGTSSSPLINPVMFQEGIGLLSYDAECVNGSTAYLMTSSNRVISFDPGAGEVEVGFFIGDKFDADFDASEAYLTFHEGSSEDMALYVADGSTGWYRMGILGAPESGNVWSPFREIVGGCGMVQSVEVEPGIKTLLIGAETSGPILQRDYSVNTDFAADVATPYPMNLIIGSVMLCQPGTEAVVEFVTLDSLRIGSKPTVGLLLGELSGYATTPNFVTLSQTSNDLPLLPASLTLYSERYDMAQNQNQQSCRHLQMRIDWAAEDIANELLTHTIYGGLRPEA
jgi:hypothetical protein